jgi:hypothetical protein
MLEVTNTPLHEILGGALYTGILAISGSYRGKPIIGYGSCDLVGWSTGGQ